MAAEKKLDEAAKASVEVTPAKSKTAAYVTYVCINKCYWESNLYKEGDTVTVAAGKKVPEHFKKA